VDEAIAHHILEHLTSDEFFHFMKELYRVLKPGAVCSIAIPHPRHNVFLNDPTHKMPVTPDTIAMFCQANFRAMIEKTGGRLTPFFRYCRIDFDMTGAVNCVLDERITEEQRTSGKWIEMEKRENNVVIEWRFLIKTVKPFLDMGEPVPLSKAPQPLAAVPTPKKSPVHKV
jgi:SAM-dependent methyltransferase